MQLAKRREKCALVRRHSARANCSFVAYPPLCSVTKCSGEITTSASSTYGMCGAYATEARRARRSTSSSASIVAKSTSISGPETTVRSETRDAPSRASGSHPLPAMSASFSARHIVNLFAEPIVVLSVPPRRAPPMFCKQSLSARPTAALERVPDPSAPKPKLMPASTAAGPPTITQGVPPIVVQCAP